MMVWTERLTSRSATENSANAKTGLREWFVDIQDVSAARALFKEQVPDWAGFPGEERFTYDGHEVRLANGAAGCVVTARYSTNKGNRAVILGAPPASSIDWTSQRVDCPIPLNARAWVVSDDASTVGVWEQTTINRSREYPVILIAVTVRGGTVRQFDVVAAETGKVHVINGEAFQLLAGSVVRMDERTWKVTYRYLADKGTLASSVDSDFLRFIAPADRPTTDTYTGVTTSGYWRLPFEQLRFLKSSNPVTTEHGTYSVRPTLNADGWRNLPGARYFDRDSNAVPSLGFGSLDGDD
jgi:hypothetical protein